MSKSNCGIYYIRNIITKELYIGQSERLHERRNEHLNQLRKNCHFNNHLQNSFNKYGEDAFEFKVIEHCEPEYLDEYETAYVDMYNLKKHGFNICDGGVHVCPDNSNENHGMWRHDISNEKIKEMYLGEFSSREIAEYFNCSRRTIERRIKKIFSDDELISIKNKKRLTGKSNLKLEYLPHDDIKELYLNGCSQKEISKKYHCTTDMVRKSLILSLGNDYAKIKESLFPKKKPSPTKKIKHVKIDLNELVELYKQGHSTLKLSDKYNCSKQTILSKLKQALKEDYDFVKQESFKNRQSFKNEDILKLANEGYNSVEIAEKLGCSGSAVMVRLKKLYTSEEYDAYKSKNRSRKMSEIYKNHYTDKSKLKRINKMKKYTLWDGSNVHYMKRQANPENPSFYVRFNSKDVNMGKFIDFVSAQIVHDLIVDFS